MAIKEKDFVELDYTGRLEDGSVFDTTSAKVAEDNDAFNPNAHYHPMVVCVGMNQLVPGLEKAIVGKEPSTFSLDLEPEDAFGKKRTDMIQLIPTKKFLENKVRPEKGLQVNVDGSVGVVKTVSGGRTLVDFNHPLSGKKVSYEVTINRIVTDQAEQVNAVLHSMLGHVEADVKDGKATISLPQELPPQIQEAINTQLKDLTGVKEVEYKKV